jgi:hypothetical protein
VHLDRRWMIKLGTIAVGAADPHGVTDRSAGVGIDEPLDRGLVRVALSAASPRATERDRTFQMRGRFMKQYRAFVAAAALGPDQENAMRGVYADAQIMLRLSRAARAPDDQKVEEMTKSEVQSEADIQKQLTDRLATILTGEQQRLLRSVDFPNLQVVNGLGCQPFDISHR